MSPAQQLLAVIPARGGSKGLPGKSIRPFVGLPLIAHTILFAKMCPEITRCIVSTDSEEIAGVARRFGAEVPFLRPTALARDDATMWAVLRHALEMMEQEEGGRYEALGLLDPTSPARLPSDVAEAWRKLCAHPEADGVIGVSRPDFNPIWHCVIEREGWMVDLDGRGALYERRQDAPVVYRINGSLYLWRTAFVRREPDGLWRQHGKHLLGEIPERRAMSIDTAEQFERAEALVKAGVIQFPWMRECPVA